MPQVAAVAVISGLSTYAAGATFLGLTGIAAALAAAGASLVLGGISQALTPKPKRAAAAALTNRPGTVAVRQTDLTHTHVYGHARAVRGYAHIESTDDNRNLHMIIILCQGELRAINEVWINDYAIPNDWLDVDGNVTQGRYADKLQIRKHTGASDQSADVVAIANIPDWTSTDRLQGIAYLYCKMVKDQDVYPTGVPNVTAVVEGPTLYDPRITALNWTTNLAQYARDFILANEYGYGAFSDDVNDTNISAEMNICDEMVTVADKAYTGTSVDTSLDLITIDGDLLSLEFGDQVQVSSGGSLPTGLSAATNYYVIPYQIKDTPRIGLATSLANAMAKTYIDLTTAGSGGLTITKKAEPRYHGGGTFDSEAVLSSTLADIVSSMAGRAYPIGGAWTILSGAWRSPAVEFTIDDLRGSGIVWKNGLSMSDSYNLVKGTFSGPSTYFQDTDYPAAKYDEFIEDDYGQESSRDLNLSYMTRATGSQRVAKIELFRGRQGISVQATFTTKAMQVQPGDVIQLTIDRYGWVQKEFEVTSFMFDATADGLFCKLGLRETAEAIYDWTSGEAIGYDPAPNTTFTTPYLVAAPTSLSYNSRTSQTSGGDSVFIMQLEWDVQTNGFVREYGSFELQFKLSSLPDVPENWSPGFFVDGKVSATDVLTASVGIEYDLRIRSRNSLGVRSSWSTLLNCTVGSSGGVVFTEDYELVTDTVGFTDDYGSVTDTIGSSEDWGYVS